MQIAAQTRRLYQIGHQRVHLIRTGADEPELEARTRSTEMLWSPYPVWADGRFLTDSVSLNISGQLIDNDRQRVKAVIQGVRALIDQPTSIIAYEAGAQLEWLHTIGVVRNIQPGQADIFNPAVLEIELEIIPYWEPLNRLLWHFGSVPGSPIDRLDPPAQYQASRTPSTARVLNPARRDKEMWVRQNYSDHAFLYNPDSWEAACQDNGKFSSWNVGGWITVDTQVDAWNAPPRTLYGFTKLPDSGTVTLRVLRQQVYTREEETITVDLAQLDSDLTAKGYTGLDANDILVIGDVTRAPGVILRNGTLLEFSPRMSYSGRWPGYLHPGQNRIFADPAGGMFAYQILYRRF